MSRCRSCDQPIDWVKTVAGKNMPVDSEYINYDEAEQGDILVTDGGNVITVDKSKRMPNVKGRMSHFATCPDAPKWRNS
ncbi:MAG: hypothetical protein E6Q97_00945 [Desulfurellales bacterium]|nr:MAG: hypothetical protein E6Q97_00945 [Desulfurellales bacterium]